MMRGVPSQTGIVIGGAEADGLALADVDGENEPDAEADGDCDGDADGL
jgi:hypothetical protein